MGGLSMTTGSGSPLVPRSTALKLITAVLLAGGAYLLAPPGMGEPARRMLAIFATVAWLWLTEALPIYVVALAVPLLLVVAGVVDNKTALAPFFHPVVALLLGGFMLSSAVSRYGLDLRIARGIMSRVGTRPWRVLLGVMGTTALLSLWLSNTATTAIMVAIVAPIVAALPQDEPFRKGLLLSIPFAANVGGIGTPVGSPPNPMAISYLTDRGTTVSFVDWMLIAVPLQLIYLVVIAVVLYFLFRPRHSGIQAEIAPQGKPSRREWTVLGIGGLTVMLWLTSRLHGVPDSIVALVPVVLLLGSGLLGVREFRGLRWDVLMLIGGGLALGVGMRESGLSDYIVSALAVGSLPPALIMLVFLSLTALLTTFMSNTATAALLIPVVGGVGARMGLEAMLVIGVGVAASLAMALPVSTPPNAIAYGQGGIRVRDMFLAGGLITLLAVVITALVGPLWWELLGYG